MKTRMEKYYDQENTNTNLRQKKNESLYDNISNLEVPDYKLETNATVIDNNAKNIDVEQIKKILDTKYNREPKRRSIVIEESIPDSDVNLDETREYDINAILEQARSEKEVDYEKERVKKLRDTQYDILSSLNLDDKKDSSLEVEEVLSSIKASEDNDSIQDTQDISFAKKDDKEANSELMDLINTITMREKDTKVEELNPLDILTDLKGSEDTIVIGGAKEEESIGETSPIMSLEEADKIKPQVMEEKKQELTNTLTFTQSDFDDFDDLKKEVKSNRALIYVAIILVCVVLIAGLVIFLNKWLNLSWF